MISECIDDVLREAFSIDQSGVLQFQHDPNNLKDRIVSVNPTGTIETQEPEGYRDQIRCRWCEEPIRETGESNLPFVHEATGNSFCNLDGIDRLFDQNWKSKATEAEPAGYNTDNEFD